MKFRYNGDHRVMTAYGYDFSDGAITDVPEDDELAVRKLSGNSHFDAVHDEAEPNRSFGVFKLKGDGDPYARPEKTFDSKELAQAWLMDQGLDPDAYLVMVK